MIDVNGTSIEDAKAQDARTLELESVMNKYIIIISLGLMVGLGKVIMSIIIYTLQS